MSVLPVMAADNTACPAGRQIQTANGSRRAKSKLSACMLHGLVYNETFDLGLVERLNALLMVVAGASLASYHVRAEQGTLRSTIQAHPRYAAV